MSIIDSQTELEEAKARLAGRTVENLVTDLSYWNVAALDAADDYRQAHERLAQIQRLHAEAQTWVALVAEEIRSRRPTIARPRTDQEETRP